MFRHKREMLGKLPGLVRLLGLYNGCLVMVQWMSKKTHIEISVPYLAHPVFVRSLSSDMNVFDEVFIDECYDIELSNVPAFVVDAGANVGMSAVYFANRYPDAQIVAVEPDPGNLCMLALNCEAYPNIKIVESAIWGKEGFLSITNPDNTGWGFIVAEVGQDAPGAFPAITMNTIMETFGQSTIGFLKMDIEGAERFVFAAAKLEWLGRTEAMVIEVHDYEHEDCREPVVRACETAGLVLRSEQNHVCVFTRRQNGSY